MKILKIALFFTTVTLTGLTRTGAAEPTEIGYERWTQTSNLSGVIFNQEPGWYYKAYADKMSIANVPINQPANPYRLIDIEMSGDKDSGYLMDAVWVENKGDFKTKSWMLHGLTAYDVLSIKDFSDIVILDLEAYEGAWGAVTEYAMIVRRNSQEFEYDVLLNVFKDFLIAEINSGDWRPIDIDVLHNDGLDPDDPAAWNNVRYNAILVKNTGDNLKATRIRESESSQDIKDAALDGMQLIDMEPTKACVSEVINCPTRVDEPCDKPVCGVGTEFFTVYVDNGLPYGFASQLPIGTANAESQMWGRSVDVESTGPQLDSLTSEVASVFVP